MSTMIDLIDEYDVRFLLNKYRQIDLDDHLTLRWLATRYDLRYNGFPLFKVV